MKKKRKKQKKHIATVEYVPVVQKKKGIPITNHKNHSNMKQRLLEACMAEPKMFLFAAFNEAAKQKGKQGILPEAFEFLSRELLAILVTDTIIDTGIAEKNDRYRIDPNGHYTIKIY